MPAYPEAYLSNVIESQGKLFDYVAQQFTDKDTIDFINTYMNSETRASIDNAQAYVNTMDAKELFEYFVQTDHYKLINGKAMETVGNGGSGNAPRVAIAQRKDGIVLFLVTNTKYFYSGPNFTEMIEVLQKYGAYNAANLDGGNSSVLVINNKIVNRPINWSMQEETRPIATGFIVTE